MGSGGMSVTAPEARSAIGRSRRRPPQLTLLREIRRDTPVHRIWAGTKLLAVAALSVTLSFFPTWGAVGVIAGLLLATAVLARIPPGAAPRPPMWFWLTVVVAGSLTVVSGGSPYVHIGHSQIGLGGVDSFLRFVAVGAVLLLASALVGWTTPLGDIAPALATLLRPLRLIRLPVDEWAVAVALCVRSLPLLVGELRTLVAARRLRPPPPRPSGTTWQRWLDEPIDLLVAALAVSMRRAGELAEAISARGGTGLISARRRRFGVCDGVTLAVVSAACTGAALVAG
jgi:energy-coupling factor transporter transmembrane protein EcfT